jgi:hypothetical protein
MAASSSALSGPKGRPPLRSCPDDFEVIFVEKGRDGCESWYRARRDTVTRWLSECGKDRLIKARANFVSHQRANGRWITRATNLVEHREVRKVSTRQPVKDKRKVSFTLARHSFFSFCGSAPSHHAERRLHRVPHASRRLVGRNQAVVGSADARPRGEQGLRPSSGPTGRPRRRGKLSGCPVP